MEPPPRSSAGSPSRRYETTTDILIAFRFKDGKVDRSAEVCSLAFEKFWAATGITEKRVPG